MPSVYGCRHFRTAATGRARRFAGNPVGNNRDMANLIFPCESCGVWHDASVSCPTSQQLRTSSRDGALDQTQTSPTETAEPQLALAFANLVRQADQMENEALQRFHLLRDLGPASEDLT